MSGVDRRICSRLSSTIPTFEPPTLGQESWENMSLPLAVASGTV
jgi:hypothetical protein